MELFSFVTQYLPLAADWWHSLGYAAHYYMWLGSGVVGFLVWLYFGHMLMRKLLGHRKWRGTWYNEHQYQELINILFEDQASGRRVMRHDEISALRDWTQGERFRGLGLDKSDGY